MEKLPLGHVTVWKMTEEERLAYIAKHPIKPFEDEEPRVIPNYKWKRKGNKREANELQ